MKVRNISAWTGLAAALAMMPIAGAPTAMAATNSTASNTSSQTLQPSQVKALPGGGKEYIYNIDGKQNVFPVPPQGFSPLNATDAQLQEYGFPARPTVPQKLKQWQEDMSHWKYTPVPKVELTSIYNEPNSTAPAPSASTASAAGATKNTQYSYNWSGYNASSTYNEWVAVQGNFTQPTQGATACSGAKESAWAGIGGINSGGLIQAGTELNNNSPYAWYEYLGKNGGSVSEIKLSSITVHTGDNIHVYVDYQASTGKSTFYVADNTTGTSQSVTVQLGSNYYDGTTAEWIDERPTVNGSYAPLANYQQNPWTNAQVYSTYGYWNDVGSLTHNQMFMEDTSGNIMSASSALTTSSSWTDYWHRCN